MKKTTEVAGRLLLIMAGLGLFLLGGFQGTAQSQVALRVSPTSLRFTGQTGGQRPDAQFLTLVNVGESVLKWQASTDVDWVILGAPAAKIGVGQVVKLLVLLDTQGLASGTHRGAITVENVDAQEPPIQVDVTLTLVEPAQLEVSPSSLSFEVQEGGSNPSSQTLTIKNTGGKVLSWTAAENLGWLNLIRTKGSLDAGETEQITVSVDVSGLGASNNKGQIVIFASGVEGSPMFVDVTLTVAGRPTTQPGSAPAGMVEVPGGSFKMGDSFGEGDSDELPVHTVNVSGFYMDKFEVTKGLWDEVADWASSHGYDIGPGDGSTARSDGTGSASEHPVTFVSWYEAAKWANARSEQEGLVPMYYTSSTQSTVYRTGKVNVRNDWVKWNANGYRLPTEAEWEKAARGGLSGKRYPWGDGAPVCESDALGGTRFDDDDKCNDIGTASVGTYLPNGYGLYDMAGNVWEWNWDWFGSYASSSVSDPRGPASGSSRVERGGSWVNIAIVVRVALRLFFGPGVGIFFVGFRLVRAVSSLPS